MHYFKRELVTRLYGLDRPMSWSLILTILIYWNWLLTGQYLANSGETQLKKNTLYMYVRYSQHGGPCFQKIHGHHDDQTDLKLEIREVWWYDDHHMRSGWSGQVAKIKCIHTPEIINYLRNPPRLFLICKQSVTILFKTSALRCGRGLEK